MRKILSNRNVKTFIYVLLFVLNVLCVNRVKGFAEIASGICGTCSWIIDDDGVLTIRPTNGVEGTLRSCTRYYDWPWDDYRTKVKSVVIENGVSGRSGCAYMFYDMTQCKSIDLEGFDTINVTDMSNMFYNCSDLTSVNLGVLNTENVTYMNMMFYNCTSLTSLDVSSFNTENVEDMSYMFSNCRLLRNLDISGFNTGNVYNMTEMFSNCMNLRNIDVSGFDTGNVDKFYAMFSNCYNLSYLDLSGFDTSKAGDMGDMFSGCNKLSIVELGPDFTFQGDNISWTGSMACLPKPSGDIYTGSWVNKANSSQFYSETDLRDNYNGASMSGTWVWEIWDSTAVVYFDANGGYLASPVVTQKAPLGPVSMPEASRPNYYITEWNTEKDGNGTTYTLSDTYTPTAGEYKTLYAQWGKYSQVTVNHFQENSASDSYDLTETEVLLYKPNDIVTPPVKTYQGFVSPSGQEVTVPSTDDLVVDYYYDRTHYTIHFDGNGNTSGQMSDQEMTGAVMTRLLDNRYKKDDHIFAGWNTESDGSGASYSEAQAVKDLAGDGETKTLYAMWTDISTASVTPTEGKYIVRLKAGETATIPELPAGTSYTITEINNPDGWTQTGSSETSGIISANQTKNGNVTNNYQARGTGSFVAYKTMQRGELSPGEFEFELLQYYTPIQAVRNGDEDPEEYILDSDGETAIKNPYYGMSVVRFDDIEFTSAGTYTYMIREKQGSNASIDYDTHYETVIMHVSDNGDGTLTCVPEYDADGPVFTNNVVPTFDDPNKTGQLLITKESNRSENIEFDFTLELTDDAGIPLTDPYVYEIVKTENIDDYKSVNRQTVSAVSYTQNLNELGVQQSNYGNRWSNFNIRGTGRTVSDYNNYYAHVITFAGAKHLHVTIVYGGESSSYDWVCMWQGAHPEYNATSNASSSLTGQLGGGYHTYASNTKEYDVPGDSVTFSFRSDGSGYGEGYGYYAVVTGEVETVEYNDNLIRTGEVTSGDTIHLKAGETIVINGLPEGAHYVVEETDIPDGYELVDSSGTEGTISEDAVAQAQFSNIYSAEGHAEITLNKTLEGRDLEDGEFTFRLLDSSGEVLQEATNNADGDISFVLDYTQDDAGQRYGYTVVEVEGDNPAIIYDTYVESVIVDVSDNGDGTLNTEVSFDGDGSFRNTYYEKHTEISMTKWLSGRPLADGEFTFRLLDSSGEILQETTNNEDGEIIFDLVYTLHDIGQTYEYSVIEVEGTDPDVSYDPHAESVTVEVNENGDGTLDTDVSYGGYAIFENLAVMEKDVRIHKVTDHGLDVVGATLSVSGTTVYGDDIAPITFASESAYNGLSLVPGDYVLHEVSTPDDDIYDTASDISFSVDSEGIISVDGSVVETVIMVDPYKSHEIEVSKLNTDGDEIAGASLKITGRETGASADITPITWTSGSDGETVGGDLKAHTVNLKPGSYTLHEESAPNGYLTASDIAFTVDVNGNLTIDGSSTENVTMEDPYEVHTISVEKGVTGNMGNRSKQFNFTLELEDGVCDAPETLTYTKNGTEGEVTVSGGKYSFTLSHGDTIVFNDIPYGSDYKITETGSDGYQVTKENDEGTVGHEDIEASFTNRLQASVPTLIVTGISSLIILGGGIAFGTVTVISKKRKKKQISEVIG